MSDAALPVVKVIIEWPRGRYEVQYEANSHEAAEMAVSRLVEVPMVIQDVSQGLLARMVSCELKGDGCNERLDVIVCPTG
jgi:hypothetical protein